MIAFHRSKKYLYSLIPDHMKTKLLLLAISCLVIFSCTKPNDDIIRDENSFVMAGKYACGPSCDGIAWMIHTAYGDFEVSNMPSDFREYDLPVKVEFYRTGKVAAQWKGTGEELVNIVFITRR
jgi:hypothetical protein